MTPRHLRLAPACRAVVLASMLALPGAMAVAQWSHDDQASSMTSPDVEAARLSYERNHWPQAYAAFAVLADRGDADAARIALQMVRHGPALYGIRFAASDGQRLRWAALVACAGPATGAGCQVARHAP